MSDEFKPPAALLPTLELAVPMWIVKLRKQPMNYIIERAHVCAQAVAEKGDVLQFGGGKKGQTAEAFNRLAEGLACAAFAPGGVHFMDVHWKADHPERSAPEDLPFTKRRPVRLTGSGQPGP